MSPLVIDRPPYLYIPRLATSYTPCVAQPVSSTFSPLDDLERALKSHREASYNTRMPPMITMSMASMSPNPFSDDYVAPTIVDDDAAFDNAGEDMAANRSDEVVVPPPEVHLAILKLSLSVAPVGLQQHLKHSHST